MTKRSNGKFVWIRGGRYNNGFTVSTKYPLQNKQCFHFRGNKYSFGVGITFDDKTVHKMKYSFKTAGFYANSVGIFFTANSQGKSNRRKVPMKRRRMGS